MRIAVVSDLHCHEKREHSSSFLTLATPPVPISTNPLESLVKRIETSSIKADVLICPGDFADRCCVAGLGFAASAVQRIAEALSVKDTFIVPGNHDIDSRGTHGADPFAPVRNRIASMPGPDLSLQQDFWTKGFALSCKPPLALVAINSVKAHVDESEAKRGSISAADLEALDSVLMQVPAECRIRVAVTHHHPQLHEDCGMSSDDVMRRGSELLRVLENRGFILVVHGHKHHPKLSYAQGGGSTPTVFASGSLSAIVHYSLATLTRNLFHVVDTDVGQLDGCYGCGRIETWEFNYGRGWNPATLQSAGFPFRTGFGCRWPVSDVARTVATATGTSRARWRDLVDRIQQLDYVLPSDLERVFSILEADHGLVALRDNAGLPFEIAPAA